MNGQVVAFARSDRSLSVEAQKLATESRAQNTRVAYTLDWRSWEEHLREGDPRQAEDHDVANYVAALVAEGRAAATIRRRISGVRAGYRARGWPDPASRQTDAVLRGLARRGTDQRRAEPLTAELLLQIMESWPTRETDLDVRDRAVLLLGWQGALRRSEIVRLDWADVRTVSAGYLLTLRATKSGGDALDHPVIRAQRPNACPVRALNALRRRAQGAGLVVNGSAPVFTSSGRRAGRLSSARLAAAWVGRIVRKRAAAAGIPVDGLSAHSLRAGLLTSAGLAGVPLYRLLEHSRHARSDTLDGYIRGARRLAAHPAEGLL